MSNVPVVGSNEIMVVFLRHLNMTFADVNLVNAAIGDIHLNMGDVSSVGIFDVLLTYNIVEIFTGFNGFLVSSNLTILQSNIKWTALLKVIKDTSKELHDILSPPLGEPMNDNVEYVEEERIHKKVIEQVITCSQM